MRALITGVSGQDGTYLTEYLAGLGYSIFGVDLIEPPKELPLERFWIGDVADPWTADEVIRDTAPDEVYNLAAEISVIDSWTRPADFMDVNVVGFLHVLEAVRSRVPKARVFQATSSDVFGNCAPPQGELTPFLPLNPYAASKAAAHHIALCYRIGHGLFVSCGILFPHSSPRQRGGVLRKIAHGSAEIAGGRQQTLELGNDTVRDWGHAWDYVRAMHRILQQPEPWDYCVGTGEGRSVHEVARMVFRFIGLDPVTHLRTVSNGARPTDALALIADPTRIRQIGWTPTMEFGDLLRELIDAEATVTV